MKKTIDGLLSAYKEANKPRRFQTENFVLWLDATFFLSQRLMRKNLEINFRTYCPGSKT